MAARRFDSLTRSLAADASRRTLLAGASSGLLAVLSLALAGESAGAKKKRKKRKTCQKGETRCGKKCVRGSCCPGEPCGPFCTCLRSVEGRTFCGPISFMAFCDQCGSSANDCQADERCAKDDQCGPGVTAVCTPICVS